MNEIEIEGEMLNFVVFHGHCSGLMDKKGNHKWEQPVATLQPEIQELKEMKVIGNRLVHPDGFTCMYRSDALEAEK